MEPRLVYRGTRDEVINYGRSKNKKITIKRTEDNSMRENNQMKYEKKKKIGSKMQTEIIHERSLLNYPLQINPDDIGLVKSAQDKQIMDDGYRCSGLFGTSVKHFSLTRTYHHFAHRDYAYNSLVSSRIGHVR